MDKENILYEFKHRMMRINILMLYKEGKAIKSNGEKRHIVSKIPQVRMTTIIS
jgi:hypothetical protein